MWYLRLCLSYVNIEIMKLVSTFLKTILFINIKRNYMNNLKSMLLSSVELHGKCDIYGLLNLYPMFTKRQIFRELFNLRNEGWIKINKHRVIDGVTTNNPNVSRTKKQMYTQSHFNWLAQ